MIHVRAAAERNIRSVAEKMHKSNSHEPVIVKESEHSLRRDQILPEARQVMERLHAAGYKGYLCGGGVRDLLLGIQPKDFDVVTDARPEEVKKVFRNCRIIGRRFKLAHIFFKNVIIETATFRARVDATAEGVDEVPLPSRRNTDIPDPTFAVRNGVIMRDNVYGTPAEDALRRDFTVNGLFYNIADGSIIDYVGGLNDLERKVLRVIGDPAARFLEDPVRMVRAIRIASQLDFEIERKARHAIMEMCGALENSSRERMFEEIQKIHACGACAKVFDRAWRKRIFQTMFPAYSNWLSSPEGAAGLRWLKKAFRQFDVWKQNGLKPEKYLQLAMMFGPYIEFLAGQAVEKGEPEFEAVTRMTYEVMKDKDNLIQVPKFAIYDAQRILGMQIQMKKSSGSGKHATRLRHRAAFDEALVYLKFASGEYPDRKEILTRWVG